MTRAQIHDLEAYRAERRRRPTVDDELCRVLFVGAVIVVSLTILARVVWL